MKHVKCYGKHMVVKHLSVLQYFSGGGTDCRRAQWTSYAAVYKTLGTELQEEEKEVEEEEEEEDKEDKEKEGKKTKRKRRRERKGRRQDEVKEDEEEEK